MSFLIRWLHVSSVAFIFGGALLIFVLLRFGPAGRDTTARRVLFDLMRAFEWVSWASLALVVATGVGNLAHFGGGLPGPGSDWGGELTLKLGLVLAFLVFSVVRTMAVATAANQPLETAPARQHTLGMLYGVTSGSVAGIVAVAIGLAHF